MKYFQEGFLSFFSELENNNNREWFQTHKKRYEKDVKEPFSKFISDLIFEISEREGPILTEPKQAIFRIYRDVRFSKDKSPYKLHASALIGKNGKKDKSTPGLYFQANHVDARIYTGMYELDKEKLKKIRSYIVYHSDELNELINQKIFKDTFGEILGEKNKRLPPEFQEAGELQPLIYNKNFYVFHKLKPKDLLKTNLMDQVLFVYEHSAGLRKYFTEALQD